jgi:hypothetical protein
MNTNQTPAEIVATIRADWANPSFAAVPYLEALEGLQSWESRYMFDDARGLAAYLLANLGSYRGETARSVKATLKAVSR